jgi:hypothetical protein
MTAVVASGVGGNNVNQRVRTSSARRRRRSATSAVASWLSASSPEDLQGGLRLAALLIACYLALSAARGCYNYHSRTTYDGAATMSNSSSPSSPFDRYTTNERDRREAEKLKARLREKSKGGRKQQQHPAGQRQQAAAGAVVVPQVDIAAGRWKYVQVSAVPPPSPAPDSAKGGGGPSSPLLFVTSRRGAKYHRNAAEPLVGRLEESGYSDIRILGGGRIVRDDQARKIKIYGFSYTFGRVDHDRARDVVLRDPRYANYEVTTSDEGY